MADEEVKIRAEMIIAMRRRCNASGQHGEDMANIIAALSIQKPQATEQFEQLDLFAA